MNKMLSWAPAIVMGLGALFTVGIDTQRSVSLDLPLDTAISRELAGYYGYNVEISDAEVRVAAPTSYLMRNYEPAGGQRLDPPWFSLYIGYYARQMRGVTIHSPKNCLPGAGWEALASEPVTVSTASGIIIANRYILQRQGEQALVLYWYQGRGRVESNEYVVKLDLLRDAATRRRSEEALVRIVVPIAGVASEALELAVAAAAEVMPALEQALPVW